MSLAFAILGIIVMFLALFLVPLGLPGVWIMLVVLAVGAGGGEVSTVVLVLLVALAAAAEILEYVFVKQMSARYGGSRLAFWGALLGGLVGVLVGVPLPVIGPLLAGVLGTFAGAAVVTLAETRRLQHAARVGWGVVLARILAVAAKSAAGIVILVVGSVALLFG